MRNGINTKNLVLTSELAVPLLSWGTRKYLSLRHRQLFS